MSLLRSVFVVVSPLLIASALSGCTDPTKYIACTSDSECPTQEQLAHELLDGGNGDNPPVPVCCAGYCVVAGPVQMGATTPAQGCDSGLRFVTTNAGDPNVGICVPNNGLNGTGGGVCAPMTAPAADASTD